MFSKMKDRFAKMVTGIEPQDFKAASKAMGPQNPATLRKNERPLKAALAKAKAERLSDESKMPEEKKKSVLRSVLDRMMGR